MRSGRRREKKGEERKAKSRKKIESAPKESFHSYGNLARHTMGKSNSCLALRKQRQQDLSKESHTKVGNIMDHGSRAS